MALAAHVIEIWKYQKWAKPFIWIGMNSIAIYLGSAIMNFRHLSQRFIGGEIKDWLGSYHEFFTAIITLSLMLRLAHFLYKNKIFIRL